MPPQRRDSPPHTGGPDGFRRVVGLDMVRSVAILMVLVCHGGILFLHWEGRTMPWQVAIAGFYGVELFFVLSGFLIGRLLIELVARPFGWRDWWVFLVRRWMRTLPLYFVCLALLAVLWPPRFWEAGPSPLWRDLLFYATMTQNLAWPPIDTWLGVSWSLTVEEWFYLTFSAALLGGVALLGRPRLALALCLAAFLGVPPVLRFQMPDSADWNEVVSKVVPLRLDAIAWGVAMAWLFLRVQAVRTRRLSLLAAGVLGIVASWSGALAWVLGVPPDWQRVLAFDVVSISFALCLPAAALLTASGTWLDTVARTISALSYALYLTHLDVLSMTDFYKGQFRWHPWLCIVVSSGAIIVVSFVLHRAIERPLMAMRPDQKRPRWARAAVQDAAGTSARDPGWKNA